MLTDITLGQYFPGTSFLHRMDPRMKISLLFVWIVGIFVFDMPKAYGVFTAATVLLAIISRVPLLTLTKSIKPLWMILVFTLLIHMCGTPGEALFHISVFEFTKEGFMQGFVICLRLALLIFLSSLLTFTTSPLELTDAMESLLSPLKCIGVPAHELAMMMSIALRFVPTLIEETDKIMKAQQSRGVNFESGNVIKRLSSLVPILVPLFISAFRRADELAMAMEARCYRGGEGRTRMKELKVRALDYGACACTVVLMAALVVMKVEGI
ncbi:MAG: energy-coupling factor transporter transmembrane protein EcfT [Schwartzia sp.]|nr:energy-coupling factor transporter transmembrane protein EcfT [Schwartzia sp. (in: firmicutes)]